MNEKLENANNLSVPEYIKLLFECTEDGILEVPYLDYITLEESTEKVKICWSRDDADSIIDKAQKLISDIKEIASKTVKADDGYYDRYIDDFPELCAVFDKYLLTLDGDDVDYERFFDIGQQIEIELMDNETESEAQTDDDEEIEPLTDEDYEYYEKVISGRINAAEKRIGGKVYFYDVVVRSQRLYHLLLLGAPKIIVENEERCLAEALALNAYGDEYDENN